MAAQVAHDIRSPLSALASFLNELGTLPQQQRNLIRSAIFGLTILRTICLGVRRTLALSRAGTHSLALLVES